MEAIRFSLAAERAVRVMDELVATVATFDEVLAMKLDDVPLKGRAALTRAQLSAAEAKVEVTKDIDEIRAFLIPPEDGVDDG